MKLTRFDDRESASRAAAELLTQALRNTLAHQDRATLVVSGGTTPETCLSTMSHTSLPWQRIDVSVTDERCVPADHPDSNQLMVRSTLIQHEASNANFVAPADVAAESFAAVLVGMGSDGHFASLFPDAINLNEGLDLNCQQGTLEIATRASPHRRISMSLARLTNARTLVLLIFGEDKLAVVESPDGLPIEALLNQNQVPVQIIWSP